MLTFKKLVVALLIHQSNAVASVDKPDTPRQLSLQLIAGYEPQSIVTDQNALDLDQKTMQSQLAHKKTESFLNAKRLYTEGGNSNSYAELTLTKALTRKVPANTYVTGYAPDGINAVSGFTLGDQPSGSIKLSVLYEVSEVQDEWVGCRVGGLTAIRRAFLEGCFEEEGNITVGGKLLDYKYNMRENNKNGRTLQKLSTEASADMLNCKTCPYVTFNKFYKYYGNASFGDEWVTSAFNSNATNFRFGNADFSTVDITARQQVIELGTVLLNVYHYVIYKLEQALDQCDAKLIVAVHPWDEAVAYYTGSSEGDDGSGVGHLLSAVADNNCKSFKTCGESGDMNQGQAKVNIDIFRAFKQGQSLLGEGKCSEARVVKERIEALMAVPMIQGTLRFAYYRGEIMHSTTVQAKGAAFAAAVLPLIYDCNPTKSETIYNAMAIGSGVPNFPAVKAAFEYSYRCLGLTCADIGGYYDDGTQSYYKGAESCAGSGNTKNVGAIVGGVLAGFTALLLAGLYFTRKRRNPKTKSYSAPLPPDDKLNEEYNPGYDEDTELVNIDVI